MLQRRFLREFGAEGLWKARELFLIRRLEDPDVSRLSLNKDGKIDLITANLPSLPSTLLSKERRHFRREPDSSFLRSLTSGSLDISPSPCRYQQLLQDLGTSWLSPFVSHRSRALSAASTTLHPVLYSVARVPTIILIFKTTPASSAPHYQSASKLSANRLRVAPRVADSS